ncbi:MAG: LysM peptidoglycan-binding domain-containing protein [Desulfobacteraceae bacterium]|nr:LysM peptidoglycan-binding domain-containing protein [Desulfobacteraceae bacterium]
MKKLFFLQISIVAFLFFAGCSQPYQKTGLKKDASISGNKAYPSDPSHASSQNNHRNGNSDKSQPELDEALDLCGLAQEYWEKGELENALETLDQAYALILDVADAQSNPKFIQQKEDLRFLISKRILEIYASRNTVVSGNFNEIPLTLNKHVQAEIDLFTSGRENNFFLSSYQRSGLYRDYIVSQLKAAGIPEELSWLPLIESGFKVNALSTARALGLWQFIPSTGYKFGLNRDKYIDERLDPVKSTQAAIAYLKELHSMFGDWSTVLAAYNCGEGRVLRLIKDQNINYLDNFWDLYEKLPSETARYVPRFLATLHIIKNPEKYGLKLPEPYPAFSYDTVAVSKQVHLKDMAAKIGVPVKDLKDLNPELRHGILPNEEYTLRLPVNKGKILLASIDEIPISQTPNPFPSAYGKHVVSTGETLSSIARKHNTSINKIIYANGLQRSNHIAPGDQLKIPMRGTVVYDDRKPSTRSTKKVTNYTVKRGDSLYIIAKKYGTTAHDIQQYNKLSTKNLSIGQKLKIPTIKETELAKAPDSKSKSVYIVQAGDSPFFIAKKHKMTVTQLLSLNSLSQKCKIFPGQRLYVR